MPLTCDMTLPMRTMISALSTVRVTARRFGSGGSSAGRASAFLFRLLLLPLLRLLLLLASRHDPQALHTVWCPCDDAGADSAPAWRARVGELALKLLAMSSTPAGHASEVSDEDEEAGAMRAYLCGEVDVEAEAEVEAQAERALPLPLPVPAAAEAEAEAEVEVLAWLLAFRFPEALAEPIAALPAAYAGA